MKTNLPIAALFILLILSSSCALSAGAGEPAEPPAGFKPLGEIDLAQQDYVGETVGQFTLPETAGAGIFFSLQEIDAPLFDLSLATPGGDSLVILHSEGFRTDRNGGGLWEQNLPSGTYRLVLTARDAQGVLSLSWGYQQGLGEK